MSVCCRNDHDSNRFKKKKKNSRIILGVINFCQKATLIAMLKILILFSVYYLLCVCCVHHLKMIFFWLWIYGKASQVGRWSCCIVYVQAFNLIKSFKLVYVKSDITRHKGTSNTRRCYFAWNVYARMNE